jgi:hypothetical protein
MKKPLRIVTPSQLSHIQELVRRCKRVAFLGFDAKDQPVIAREDAKGIVVYAIAVQGNGVTPDGEVRSDFTNQEVEELTPRAMEILCSLPMSLEEP